MQKKNIVQKSISIDEELFFAIRKLADKQNRSFSNFVCSLLIEFVAGTKNKEVE